MKAIVQNGYGSAAFLRDVFGRGGPVLHGGTGLNVTAAARHFTASDSSQERKRAHIEHVRDVSAEVGVYPRPTSSAMPQGSAVHFHPRLIELCSHDHLQSWEV